MLSHMKIFIITVTTIIRRRKNQHWIRHFVKFFCWHFSLSFFSYFMSRHCVKCAFATPFIILLCDDVHILAIFPLCSFLSLSTIHYCYYPSWFLPPSSLTTLQLCRGIFLLVLTCMLMEKYDFFSLSLFVLLIACKRIELIM